MKSIKPHVIRAATKEDCIKLAENLRDIDRQEVWAVSGFLPRESILFAFENSKEVYTAHFEGDDVPILMYGIGYPKTIFDQKQQIWMLASDKIYDVPFRFLRLCGDHLKMIASGKTVYNYVLEGNNKTLKWLHWLKFTIMKPKQHGLMNRKFHYVERTIPCADSTRSH